MFGQLMVTAAFKETLTTSLLSKMPQIISPADENAKTCGFMFSVTENGLEVSEIAICPLIGHLGFDFQGKTPHVTNV